MNIAITTAQGRVVPCFSGAELWWGPGDGNARLEQEVSTQTWHPLSWGRELMLRDVGVLLCAGIDHATWSAIQGHGIQVVPTAMGDPDEVVERWHNGELVTPPLWPAYGGPGGGCARRRRFRGGRR